MSPHRCVLCHGSAMHTSTRVHSHKLCREPAFQKLHIAASSLRRFLHHLLSKRFLITVFQLTNTCDWPSRATRWEGVGRKRAVCVCVSSPSYTIPAEPVPPVISCWAFSTSVLAHPHVSHCCAIREPCWEGRRFVFGLRKHVGDARAIAGLLLHCKNFLGGRSPDPYNQGCLLGRLQGCLPDTAGVYRPLRQELS